MTRPLSEHEFQDRFSRVVHSEHGSKVVGSRNTDQLREMIKTGFLRLTKREVRRDFPAIRYVTTPIALPGTLPEPWTGDRLHHIPDDELLSRLETMDHLLPLATARRELGVRKVKPVLEWVNAWLSDSDPSSKLLLFAIHREVIDAFYAALIGDPQAPVPTVVKIDGRTPAASRLTAMNVFQNDPACRVFLGQIVAAGESVTLTAASTVAIAEAEFVPSRIAQAAARAHRIGQHNAVLVHLLSVPHSLDMRVNRIAVRKAQELSGLFEQQAHQGRARYGDDEGYGARPNAGDRGGKRRGDQPHHSEPAGSPPARAGGARQRAGGDAAA